MNEQVRDGLAYYESKGDSEVADWEGRSEGLLPPSQRPVPRGPVRTSAALLDAAIQRGYAEQAARHGDVIILSDRRKLALYSCSQCGSKEHTKAFHRPGYVGVYPSKKKE